MIVPNDNETNELQTMLIPVPKREDNPYLQVPDNLPTAEETLKIARNIQLAQLNELTANGKLTDKETFYKLSQVLENLNVTSTQELARQSDVNMRESEIAMMANILAQRQIENNKGLTIDHEHVAPELSLSDLPEVETLEGEMSNNHSELTYDKFAKLHMNLDETDQ